MNTELIPWDSQCGACVRAKLCCPGRAPEGLQVSQLPGLRIVVYKGKKKQQNPQSNISQDEADIMTVSLSSRIAHTHTHIFFFLNCIF